MRSLHHSAHGPVKKFIYSLKILCFRPLLVLISFTDQNSVTDYMARFFRISHTSVQIRTAKAMFVRIELRYVKNEEKNRENRLQKNFGDFLLSDLIMKITT